eukprot:jgi/Botrbrau1/3902/Bobra.0183s0123.1
MDWKEKGNASFKAGQFEEAIDCYNRALAIDAENAILYSNRSAAYLQLKDYEKALRDAAVCLKLNPQWDKGHFRKGSALESINIRQALAAYEDGLACNRENAELARKVTALRRQVRNEETAAEKARNEQDQARANERPGQMPSNNAWAKGLPPAEQREWLVDCYRMRVDDTMVWRGECVGLYSGDGEKGTVLLDFLVFCRLAVAHDVVPRNWDWPAFLTVAECLLCFAFEKSDAKEKWGGENIFRAMLGGRSLRYTAEMVYGSSIVNPAEMHRDERALREELTGGWEAVVQRPAAAATFRTVGGLAAWQKLHADMRDPGHSYRSN